METSPANCDVLARRFRVSWRGFGRARRGPYRIIYEIREDGPVVLVIRVAHRAHVHRPR